MTHDVRLPIFTIKRVAPFFWEAETFKVVDFEGVVVEDGANSPSVLKVVR
jgi:hypothetical protein